MPSLIVTWLPPLLRAGVPSKTLWEEDGMGKATVLRSLASVFW